jgi:hypothetical protein
MNLTRLPGLDRSSAPRAQQARHRRHGLAQDLHRDVVDAQLDAQLLAADLDLVDADGGAGAHRGAHEIDGGAERDRRRGAT